MCTRRKCEEWRCRRDRAGQKPSSIQGCSVTSDIHIVQFDILLVRMKSHDRQGTVNRICATDDIPIVLSKNVTKTYASIEGPNITKKKMLLSKTEMLTSKETRTLTFLLIFINVATHHAQVYLSR